MSSIPQKADLLRELRTLVEADLAVLTASQEEAQAGATHEENKAEGDKDMRSTEDSYLARGLAKRVTELRAAVAKLSSLALRTFDEDSKISLTALVEVEDEDGGRLYYFVAPVGGGIVLKESGAKVSVVTPLSPLGRALIGRELSDDVEITTPQGKKSLCVVGIS
jgi:transcription elongation GreA/GreB family factor